MELYNYLKGLGGQNSKSTSGWINCNHEVTNESGFSGLPGGYRLDNGGFAGWTSGYWWSSTAEEVYGVMAWCYRLICNGDGWFIRDNLGRGKGMSVRCVRD